MQALPQGVARVFVETGWLVNSQLLLGLPRGTLSLGVPDAKRGPGSWQACNKRILDGTEIHIANNSLYSPSLLCSEGQESPPYLAATETTAQTREVTRLQSQSQLMRTLGLGPNPPDTNSPCMAMALKTNLFPTARPQKKKIPDSSGSCQNTYIHTYIHTCIQSITTYITRTTNKVLLRVTDPKLGLHDLGLTIEIDAQEKGFGGAYR